ncbi:MAG TPA: hypothetical protein VMJ64_16840 [Anaerolineales bacterium]|nr:hypothetical protein [Anaerolineales bacterium]
MIYFVVSLASGLLFGIMDGFANANPLATRLYQLYNPVARTAVNVPAGIVIDLVYGFLMAAIYLLLYHSLPGGLGIIKGVSYALLMWFFRVVMSVLSQWVMFNIPYSSVLYTAGAGLVELLVIGMLYGLTLKPKEEE